MAIQMMSWDSRTPRHSRSAGASDHHAGAGDVAQVELATHNAGYASMNLSVSFSRGVRDFDVSRVELTGGELLGLHPVTWGDNDNLLVIEVRVVRHTYARTHTHEIQCCCPHGFATPPPYARGLKPYDQKRPKGAPTSRCYT
jgi:hypothetical protein